MIDINTTRKIGDGILLLTVALLVSCGSHTLDDSAKQKVIAQLYEDYQQSDIKGVPDVTVAQLLSDEEFSDLVLLDVRTPEERAVSMIPQALTVEAFEANRDQYDQARVIVYCTIGYRSGIYVKSLRESGIDAHNLKGGALAWAHAQQPFHDKKGETRRVHVYGETWNLAPKNYQPVW